MFRSETDESSGDNSSNSSDAEKSNGHSIPTKPVLGLQSGDTDRQVPLFYIKPVNPEGMGIKGPEGTRLEDQGLYCRNFSTVYRENFAPVWFSPSGLKENLKLS